jgi:hypothetical protein
MTGPALAATPKPEDWLRAYAGVQSASDRQVLRLLRQAYQDLSKQIVSTLGRNPSISSTVRLEQLLTVRKGMLRELSTLYAGLGRTIISGQLAAVAEASELSWDVTGPLFAAAGASEDLLLVLRESFTRSLETSGIQAMITRITQNPFTLAQRIYKSEQWTRGQVERVVNSALARGLSAREFAAEARELFNPSTPGGVRYASYRLARTEINNAFHAASIERGDHPWVLGMKWSLSRSHPHADDCDLFATQDAFDLGPGVYPVRDTPAKPHPQCLCTVSPAVEDEDDFIKHLVSGKYDNHMRQMFGEQVAPEVPSPGKLPPLKAPPPKPIAKAAAARPYGQVRQVLLNARTVEDVARTLSSEAERITGRPLRASMNGDLEVAREHAEGILTMMERFPETDLSDVLIGQRGKFDDAYAWTSLHRGGPISFNEFWTESPTYRGALRGGIEGWNRPRPDPLGSGEIPGKGWFPRNTGVPVHVAIHEFAHTLTLTTLDGDALSRSVEKLVEKRRIAMTAERDAERRRQGLVARGPMTSREIIGTEVSEYAVGDIRELMAEAVADVIRNGQAASELSRGIYDIVQKAYDRKFRK